MAARNMYRIEININEKELCVKLVVYKDYKISHFVGSVKDTANSAVFCSHSLKFLKRT